MAFTGVRNTRVPRGYEVDRPYYQELCEGVRPNVQAVPLEAWTGLHPVRIDEVHHDPIVIEPGTIVGIATGGTQLSGKLVPAFYGGSGFTGAAALTGVTHTDSAKWGIRAANWEFSGTRVKPIGVVYQPIYSFMLQKHFTNYKRNDNVGIVTNYVIQIPVTNHEEAAIDTGDLVMVGTGAVTGAVTAAASIWSGAQMLAGRYRKYDPVPVSGPDLPRWAAEAENYIVGRCFKKILLGEHSGTTATAFLKDEIVAGRFTLSSDAASEFKGLDRVQTAPGGGTSPGMPISGSGSGGVPGWLLGAVADGNKRFWALTILIRL